MPVNELEEYVRGFKKEIKNYTPIHAKHIMEQQIKERPGNVCWGDPNSPDSNSIEANYEDWFKGAIKMLKDFIEVYEKAKLRKDFDNIYIEWS